MGNTRLITQAVIGTVVLFVGVGLLLAQSSDNPLPPAKQAIEDQYTQERNEGTRNPAPTDSNTPLPLVELPPVKMGIIEQCTALPVRTFRTVNCWQGMVNGSETMVYAGAKQLAVDADGNEVEERAPQQGLVAVDADQTSFFPTPMRVGAVSIVAERNDVLTLVSETGVSFTFDVRTNRFTTLNVFKCPQEQGFWKNKIGAWPVMSLTLGDDIYAQAELVRILRTPVGAGGGADASLILGHQLIATKLSIANGSDPGPVRMELKDADALLSQFFNDKDKLPYRVKPSSVTGQAMVKDANKLDSYNSGQLTPSCQP